MQVSIQCFHYLKLDHDARSVNSLQAASVRVEAWFDQVEEPEDWCYSALFMGGMDGLNSGGEAIGRAFTPSFVFMVTAPANPGGKGTIPPFFLIHFGVLVWAASRAAAEFL